MNTKPNLWQWSQFGSGWCQNGRGYRAAGLFCGVWDVHGREWQAEVVARKLSGYRLRWKWQCRPIDDACVPDNDGDQMQIVMLRDSAMINCSETRWNMSFPASVNCQAVLMAMGFSNYPTQNPLTISHAMAEDLLELQGL